MILRLLIFTFIATSNVLCYSQNYAYKTDSIFRSYPSDMPNWQKIDLITTFVEQHKRVNLNYANYVNDSIIYVSKLYQLPLQEARALFERAMIADFKNQPDVLIESYKQAAEIYKTQLQTAHKSKINYITNGLSLSYNNIGNAYVDQGYYQLGLDFFHYSLAPIKPTNDSIALSMRYYNIAMAHMNLENYDSAHYYINSSKIIEESLKSDEGLAYANSGISRIYLNQAKYKKSEKYALLALENLKNYQDPYLEAETLDLLGDIYSYLENDSLSLVHYNAAYELSIKVGNNKYAMKAYKHLGNLHYKMGNYQKSADLFYQLSNNNDSLSKIMMEERLADFRVQYETEVKELENNILKQKNELQAFKLAENRGIIALLILTIAIITLGIGIFVIRIRLKRNMIDNKLKDDYVKLMIKTQETERKKIARVLHDNYGASLAAVKLTLLNASDEIKEPSAKINRAIDIVNSVGTDIRNLSHELLPYQSEHFGFKLALEELFEKLFIPARINFSFNTNMEDVKLSDEFKFGIYQIFTELANNTLKHSKATNVEIGLIQSNNQIIISLEDNGIGTPQKIKRGVGVNLIEAQLISLNGKLSYSSTKKGLLCKVVIHNKENKLHRI